jgi:hypothetical protein
MNQLYLMLPFTILAVAFAYAIWFFFNKNFQKFNTHEIIAISNGIFGKYYDDDENGVEVLQRYRYQKGGEALINPITQSVKVLPANKIVLEVESQDMRTADDYFISATTVIIFSIDSSCETAMRTAFESFGGLANKKIDAFKIGVLEILEPLVDSATSTIVGRLSYDDLKKDENKFNTEAKNTIKEKFHEMGLVITSISLKNDAIDNPLYNQSLQEKKTLEITKELEEEKLKNEEILAERRLQTEKLQKERKLKEIEHNNKIEMAIKEQALEMEIKHLEQNSEKERVEAQVEIEIKKRQHEHVLEEEQQKHAQSLLQKEQEMELKEKELKQRTLFTEQELEEKNVIRQKEFDYGIQIQKQKIKETEVQKEQEFSLASQDERYRAELSEFKRVRIEAEQEIIEQEEEHNIKVFRNSKKAKVLVEKEIEEINAQIERAKSTLLKTKEEDKLDVKERELSIATNNKKENIEAQNQANGYTFVENILKENPTILENSIEKVLGKKGMAGVASGFTKHLGSIESIRIADLGGNGTGGESAIEKYAHIPPNMLAKFTTRLNALGFSDLLSRFKIGQNSFDNLGEKKSAVKDILFDEKNNTILFDKDYFEELLEKVGLEPEMLDELLEESKKANINIKKS